MCSVDLESAYYSVAIAPSDQKYLKFSWRGKLYQFTCFSKWSGILSKKIHKTPQACILDTEKPWASFCDIYR